MAEIDSLEVEWQFDAPDLEAVEAWLRAQPKHAALTLEDRGEKTQHDTYFDTEAWHVFHAGYSLRVRQAADSSETTLKAIVVRQGGPIARAEFNEPGEIADTSATAGAVGTRLHLMLRGAPLRPLFIVVTRRRIWLVRTGASVLAEIALDDTTMTTPTGAFSTLQRVEIEEVTRGSLTLVQAFVSALRAECALTPSASSKFESGLRAAGLNIGPRDLGSTAIASDDRAVDRAYAVLRRRTAEFMACESGTALGEDPEYLHQMRVSTRRLRAALRVFDSVIPQVLLETRDELAWFAQALGAVRDLDVQLEHLEALRGEAAWAEATALAPIVAQFERQHVEVRIQLLTALDSDRYARLVATLSAVLLAGPPPDAPDRSSRDEGRRVIVRRYRRFRDDARELRRDSPHALYHALRIRGKRLRYSLELFVDLYGRIGERALASLRALQDLLGELQDLATTDQRLLDLVRTHAGELPPDTLVMIGRLMERHRERSNVIVGAFPRARAAVLRDFARMQRVLRPDPPDPVVPDDDTPPSPTETALDVPTTALVVRSATAEVPARRSALRALVHILRRRRS